MYEMPALAIRCGVTYARMVEYAVLSEMPL